MKSIFKFRLLGVASREEELFKSYVRVLNFQLKYIWLHTNNAADLTVYGPTASDEVNDVAQRNGSTGSGHSLFLSTSNHADENFLQLPLNSAQIQIELNRIGALLDLASAKSEAVTFPSVDLNKRYRLLRWPPANLLKTRDLMRLAAVMSGQSMSIAALQKRSGLELELCKSFIENMFKAGLLDASTVEVQATDSQRNTPRKIENIGQKSGLFGMIRSKLARFNMSGS